MLTSLLYTIGLAFAGFTFGYGLMFLAYWLYKKAKKTAYGTPPLMSYEDYWKLYDDLRGNKPKVIKTTHNATLTAGSWWSQQRVRKAA